MSYGLKFVQTIFIAAQLGPYFLGLWGFYLMLIEYYQYSMLGLQYSVNVELSVLEKDDAAHRKRAGTVIFNTLAMAVGFAMAYLLGSIALKFGFPELGSGYMLNRYVIIVMAIAMLNALATVFMNIYRSYDEFFEIGFTELTYTIVPFCAIFFFKDGQLIEWLLYLMLGARVIHIAMYVARFRFPNTPLFDLGLMRTLMVSGFGLMLFNISYNLFFMLSKAVVSASYAVETMGFFTFAFTITNAAVYGIQTLLFTIYSKLLYDFSRGGGPEETYTLVRKNAKAYNLAVSSVIFIIIGLLPALFYFFPQYSPVLPLLVMFLISRVIFTIGTMYGTLVFARKRQRDVVRYSLSLLLLSLPLMWAVGHFGLPLVWFGVLTVVYSMGYSVIQVLGARAVLGLQHSKMVVLLQNAEGRIMLPCVGCAALSVLGFHPWLWVMSFIFMAFNLKELRDNFKLMLELIK